MEEIAASKFKVNCLSVVEQVRKTRKPVTITRYGKPVAELRPALATRAKPKIRLGQMAGTMEILGDIVAPAFDEEEWDMLRDEPSPRYAYSGLEPSRARTAVKTRRQAAKRLAKRAVALPR